MGQKRISCVLPAFFAGPTWSHLSTCLDTFPQVSAFPTFFSPFLRFFLTGVVNDHKVLSDQSNQPIVGESHFAEYLSPPVS